MFSHFLGIVIRIKVFTSPCNDLYHLSPQYIVLYCISYHLLLLTSHILNIKDFYMNDEVVNVLGFMYDICY